MKKLVLFISFLFMVSLGFGQNLAINPGFESWTVNGAGGPPDDWSLSGTSMTATQEATTIHGGTYSTNITWTTTSTRYLQQFIDVSAGTNYQFTFWVYDNDEYGRARVAIRWYDSGGGFISGYYGDYSTDSADWQQLDSGMQLAPANTVSAHIEIRVYDVSWTGVETATVYVDDIIFVAESTDAPSITHTAQGNTTSNFSITINADITDTDLTTTTGSAPSCWYRIEGGSWTRLEDTTPVGDTFSWDIPGQFAHTLIEYYLAAQDDASNVTTGPAGGSGITPPGSTPPASFHSYNILKSSPTIYDVQNYRDGSDDSYYSGETVSLTGIVTGIYGISLYTIQNGSGAWNGIWVSNDGSLLSEGDNVTVDATIEESYNLTQMTAVTGTTTNSTGNPLPTVSTILTGTLDESYEGVYVFVDDAVCTNEDLGYGEWEITSDASTACRVDDLGYAYTPSLGNTYDVTGINYYGYGVFKIQPRYASDVVLGGDTIPPTIASVSVTDGNTVEVYFSEDVDQTTAETTSNYSIDNGIGNPSSAVRDGVDNSLVTLTVSTLSTGITYTITINNVEDLNSNPIAANSQETFQYSLPPSVGDVIINEIMQNPSAVGDSNGEYIEFYNTTDHNIDINGWTVRDKDTDSFVIANGGPLTITSYGYLVIGNDGNFTTNGGYNCDYEYSGMYLANSSDEVILEYGRAIIDSVYYDDGATFPDPTGASMELDPAFMNYVDNDDGTNWYTANTTFGDGDCGSPGSANSGPLPDPPINVVITHDGTNVTVTWDAVTGATSYIMYISTDPYAVDPWSVATGTFDLTTDPAHPTWTETTTTGTKNFYKVTANN